MQGAVQDNRHGDGQVGQHVGFSGVAPALSSLPYHQMPPPFGGAGFVYQSALGVPPPPPAPPGPPPKFPLTALGASDRLAPMHPMLKRHLEEYHQVFKGSMMFEKILQAANV
jgi:hypothetical protein